MTRGYGPAVDVGSEPRDDRTGPIRIVADAFLGKVELDLEAGDDVDERVAHGSYTISEPAGERACRERDGALGPCADHQRDGLGLGEIDAAVEERSPGELAGRRQASATPGDPLRHHPQKRRRSMTRQLDDVLAGIRPRREHDGAQRLVHALAALGVDDADPTKRVRGKCRQRNGAAKQGSNDRDRVRPAHANHPDGALAERRRDGDDRVVGARGLRPGRRLWPRALRACARVDP